MTIDELIAKAEPQNDAINDVVAHMRAMLPARTLDLAQPGGAVGLAFDLVRLVFDALKRHDVAVTVAPDAVATVTIHTSAP